jgi:hypothetical protein
MTTLMPDIKLTPEKTWFQATFMWACIALAVGGTLLYARIDSQIGDILATMDRDVKSRDIDRGEVVSSVHEVRDELRKLVTETVAQRQANAWIELARALNKAKFPELVWPDLPR